MKKTKEEDKGSRKPYEPPKLFNLGGRVAYAQTPCKVGGSPAVGTCRDGGMATDGSCSMGGAAAWACKPGGGAAGGPCKPGNTAAFACKKGSTPG